MDLLSYKVAFNYDCGKFKTYQKTMLSSFGIPFFMGKDKYTIFKHPHTGYNMMDNMMTINLLHHIYGYSRFLPYGNNIPHFIIHPTMFRSSKMKYYWISPNREQHRKLYHRGYEDCVKNKEYLDFYLRNNAL
jgi:hypothetical protein